jgi:hypothetical protein
VTLRSCDGRCGGWGTRATQTNSSLRRWAPQCDGGKSAPRHRMMASYIAASLLPVGSPRGVRFVVVESIMHSLPWKLRCALHWSVLQEIAMCQFVQFYERGCD